MQPGDAFFASGRSGAVRFTQWVERKLALKTQAAHVRARYTGLLGFVAGVNSMEGLSESERSEAHEKIAMKFVGPAEVSNLRESLQMSLSVPFIERNPPVVVASPLPAGPGAGRPVP